jgi:hypothetical protein
MRQMIANRGKKKEATEAKKDEKATETPIQPFIEQDKKPSSNLGGLIAEALKFRPDKDKKATEEPKKTAEPVKTEDKKPEPPKETPKTVVTRRKTEPAPPDPMRIASEAAAAAVKEAVGAMSQRGGAAQLSSEVPGDQLPEDYKHDFQVAKHLASTNPKYKDAPQAVLNEFTRTEQYARQWEQQNPGKAFDANSDDHDDFYATLSRPWNDHEFRTAEIEIAAERIAERKSGESDAKLKQLEEQNARHELSQVVGQTVNVVAVALARAVDEAAHDVIMKQGYNKLEEADPLTAEELVRTLNVLSPRIETAIQLDDPKGRIPFDPKRNPAHQQWLQFLFEKEEQFAGQKDQKDRLFATRNEYAKLSEAQRSRRWYLTADHLVSEMVVDASESAKQNIEQERERMKKMAAKLGYVPAEQKNGEPAKSVAPTEPKPKAPETPSPDVTKPVSPSVGGGAKIDTQGEPKKTATQNLLAVTGNILFGR